MQKMIRGTLGMLLWGFVVSLSAAASAQLQGEIRIVPAGAEVTAQVDFVGDEGLTLSRADGEETISLCTAPCAVQMQPGSYRFGLTTPEGSRLMLSELTEVSLPGLALQGEYVSYDSRRVAGWVVGGIGIGLGLIGFGMGAGVGSNEITIASFGLMAIGVGIGLVLILKADEVHIEVAPTGVRATF